MYKISPGVGQLLVRPAELGSDSDILIPDKSTNLRRPYGQVIAVGLGRHGLLPSHFAIGDKVIFNPGAAMGFHEPDGDYLLVPWECVIGKYVELFSDKDQTELALQS